MADLGPGTVVDRRFAIRERLGAGGFGSVWLADDAAHPGAPVALKVLHAKHRGVSRTFDRFVREAELLRKLEHPNLARLVAANVAGDLAYIAMEFVDGAGLDGVLLHQSRALAPIALGLVEEIFVGIADAIAYAHEQGVVHRDLKPSNIVLCGGDDGEGRAVKVLDFGIAKIVDETESRATTAGRVLGSATYLAPEQAEAGPVDHRADVFALGTLLFELLTLRRTWLRDDENRPIEFHRTVEVKGRAENTPVAVMQRIRRAPRPSPGALRPDLAPSLDAAVRRAIAVAPADRFDSVRALIDAVRAGIAASGVGDPTDTISLAESALATRIERRRDPASRDELAPVVPVDLDLGGRTRAWTREATEERPGLELRRAGPELAVAPPSRRSTAVLIAGVISLLIGFGLSGLALWTLESASDRATTARVVPPPARVAVESPAVAPTSPLPIEAAPIAPARVAPAPAEPRAESTARRADRRPPTPAPAAPPAAAPLEALPPPKSSVESLGEEELPAEF